MRKVKKMDESISKQKVIDKLDEALERITKNVNKEGDAYHIVYGTIDIIKCMIMTIQPEPHWIPVTERLPKEEGLFLVSVKNDHQRAYSKTCWYYGNGKWFARQDVTAWMPLPEPFKGVTK